MDKLVFQAFDAYFNKLGQFGYVKDKDVLKLLILAFIFNFSKDYDDMIDDNAKNMLNNLVDCLQQNTCLVPQFDYHSIQ